MREIKLVYLRDYIDEKIKQSSIHTRLLWDKIDHESDFTDKESYSYWQGYKSALKDLYIYIEKYEL